MALTQRWRNETGRGWFSLLGPHHSKMKACKASYARDSRARKTDCKREKWKGEMSVVCPGCGNPSPFLLSRLGVARLNRWRASDINILKSRRFSLVFPLLVLESRKFPSERVSKHVRVTGKPFPRFCFFPRFSLFACLLSSSSLTRVRVCVYIYICIYIYIYIFFFARLHAPGSKLFSTAHRN